MKYELLQMDFSIIEGNNSLDKLSYCSGGLTDVEDLREVYVKKSTIFFPALVLQSRHQI